MDALISTTGVRELRAEYRAGMGRFQVDSSGANAGTVGTAFDTGLRLLIAERPNLADALSGAAHLGEAPFRAVVDLIQVLGATATPHRERVPGGDPIDAPLRVPNREPQLLGRACWALALATEVYRAGIHPESPLVRYSTQGAAPDVDGLLQLATAEAAAEVEALIELAGSHLLPTLSTRPAPWFLGPVLAGSRWMDADADLIAGRALIELKTNLGTKKGDTRVPDLSVVTLRQLIAYVLHDFDDTYAIDTAGIYEARYGTLTIWPIQEFFDRLAGRSVDLTHERGRYAATVMAGPR